jgi:hypothetical protein
MLEDLNKNYTKHILHYIAKGFRVESPVAIDFPKYPAARLYDVNKQVNASADYLCYLEYLASLQDKSLLGELSELKNLYTEGKEVKAYKFTNIPHLTAYGDNYVVPLGGHEYYSWYDWSFIKSIGEVYTKPLLL